MSVSLDLPPDLESELAAEAATFRLSLPDYILRLLESGRRSVSQPRDGAELVAYWQAAGLVGTRQDIVDSASHARELRQRAERRHQP